ncbi:MAG: tetratricopeptide repeat protein [Fibromonadales bacterium]|nr:tetratricopeptide repeat protein [Fibromonadales bacterium]
MASIAQMKKMGFTQVEILRTKAQRLFHKKKEYDLAIKALSKAIGLKGEDCDIAECYFIRALIYAEKKDYDSAMADFAEAAKLRKWSRDYEGIAGMYEEKGDFDSAIAYYTKGIKVGKRCGEGYDSYFFRGKIYLEHKKNYDAAISDLKKSIKICGITKECKGCAECYRMISEAYLAKGDKRNADKYLAKTVAVGNIVVDNAKKGDKI